VKNQLRAPAYFCNPCSPLRSCFAMPTHCFTRILLRASLRQSSEYPELTVGKLIMRYIVKMCHDKTLFNKLRPMPPSSVTRNHKVYSNCQQKRSSSFSTHSIV